MQVKAASLYSGKGRNLEVISISKTGRKVVVAVPEFRTGSADFYRNAEGLYKNEYMGLVFRLPEQEQEAQEAAQEPEVVQEGAQEAAQVGGKLVLGFWQAGELRSTVTEEYVTADGREWTRQKLHRLGKACPAFDYTITDYQGAAA